MEFFKPEYQWDFVGKRKKFAVLSVCLVSMSVLLFIFSDFDGDGRKGPNWGIDFTGGNEIQLQFEDQEQPLAIGELRTALTEMGISSESVQQLGAPSENRFSIRIQDATFGTEGVRDAVETALEDEFGADWIQESEFIAEIGSKVIIRYGGDAVPIQSIQQALAGIDQARARTAPDDNTIYVELPGLASQITDLIGQSLEGNPFRVLQTDSVGPKVGEELKTQGFLAIVSTLGLILVYVAFRFQLAFAPGAVLALFHDVTIVIGVFVLLQREFNLPMIGALLTIIGYSLNDTIVIYDRIRENMTRYRRNDMVKLINTSINETMSRTLATSTTTALGMLAFLFFGGPVIETFALAILLGVIVGTYSTIFVASPTILIMQDMRPHLERLFSPFTVDDESVTDEGAVSATERRRRSRKKPKAG